MNRVVRLQVNFYKTESGHEPVRERLRSLSRTEKKVIGEDIKTTFIENEESMMNRKYVGSNFDEFLEDEGLLKPKRSSGSLLFKYHS